MMQEYVYVKLALNQNTAAAIIDALKKKKPPEGLVQILSVTEKQFSKIEIITGDYSFSKRQLLPLPYSDSKQA